jgi:hypothetical protein
MRGCMMRTNDALRKTGVRYAYALQSHMRHRLVLGEAEPATFVAAPPSPGASRCRPLPQGERAN